MPICYKAAAIGQVLIDGQEVHKVKAPKPGKHDFKAKESLHPWVKVDPVGRPLPPEQLSILEGLTLNLVHTLCRSLHNWNYLDFGCL